MNDQSINILSFNTNQTVRTQKELIAGLAKDNDADILLLQDTGIYTSGDENALRSFFRSKGYATYFKGYLGNSDGSYSAKEVTELQLQKAKRKGAWKEGQVKRDKLAILVRTELEATTTILPTGLDCTRVQDMYIRTNSDQRIYIANVYAPPEGRDGLDEVLHHLTAALGQYDAAVLMGDWNVTLDPSKDRKPPRNPTAEEQIFSAFVAGAQLQDAAALRDDRRMTCKDQSRIDMALVSPPLAPLITDFDVTEPEAADHSPISIRLRTGVVRTERTRAARLPRFRTPKLNVDAPSQEWNDWTDAVARELDALIPDGPLMLDPDTVDIEHLDNILVTCITAASTQRFGLRRKRQDRRQHASKDLLAKMRKKRRMDTMCRKLHRLLSAERFGRLPDIGSDAMAGFIRGFFNYDPALTSIETLQKIRREAKALGREIKKIVEDEKRAQLLAYQAALSDWTDADPGKAYRQFGPKNNNRMGATAIRRPDNTISVDPQEHLQLVEDHYSRLFRETEPDPPALRDELPAWWKYVPIGLDRPVSMRITADHIRSFLRRANRKAAPGLDGITMEMIYCLPIDAMEALAILLTAAATRAEVPQRWRTSVLLMLHKKGDETDLNNKRAIALAPCFGKLTEGILGRRFQYAVEKTGCMAESQFGFRWGRGCTEAIMLLDQAMDHAKRNKRDIYVAFFDAIKAFDSVNWNLLFTMIRSAGQDDYANFVQSYYRGAACQVVTSGGLTNPIYLERGILQGAVSSAFLFIYFVNPLLRWMNEVKGYELTTPDRRFQQSVTSFSFADDINAISDQWTAERELVLRAFRFGRDANLFFSVVKSELFTNDDSRIGDTIEIPVELLHPKERDRPGANTLVVKGPRHVFRVLGIHRSFKDRSKPHQDFLWPKIVSVYYEMVRKRASPWLAAAVADAYVHSLLRYAAPFVTFKKEWLARVRTLLWRGAGHAMNAGNRLRHNLLFNHDVYGMRDPQVVIHAAAVDAYVTASDPRYPLVAGTIHANYHNLTCKLGRPPLSSTLCHSASSLVSTVHEALLAADLLASWSCVGGSPLIEPCTYKPVEPPPGGVLFVHPGVPETRGLILAPAVIHDTLFKVPTSSWLTIDEDGFGQFRRTKDVEFPRRNGRGYRKPTQKFKRAYTQWSAEWTRRDPEDMMPPGILPLPTRPDERRWEQWDGPSHFYVIPSARRRIARGEYQGGVGLVCPARGIKLFFRPPSGQSAQHCCAVATLLLLRTAHQESELDIVMPIEDISNALRKWTGMDPHQRQRHPYLTTMDAIAEEMDQRKAATAIHTCPTTAFNEVFGDVTAGQINPLYHWTPDGGIPKGWWRNRASRACLLPTPTPTIPKETRLVIHDAAVSRLYEGIPSTHIFQAAQHRLYQELRRHPRLGVYFSRLSHPLTVTRWKRHRHGNVLWKARNNKLNTGDQLVLWQIKNAAQAGCPCGAQLETLHHVVYECPNYNGLRRHIRPETPLPFILGRILENGVRPESVTLKDAIRSADRFVDEFMRIWKARNELFRTRP